MRISDWSSDVCSSDLVHMGAGLATGVEPVAAGHAAALELAGEGGFIVRVLARRPQGLDIADARQHRAVGPLGALAGRVLQAEPDRVHADRLARKSAVSGTSVSVSVVLWGRRII